MNILLSAYSCEPDKGSESAVGWGWATHLSQNHVVHVITRYSNKKSIDQALSKETYPNLHFHYFDLPKIIRFWKRGNRGIYFYYLLWQIGAYRLARKISLTTQFDIIHHVTFVSMRFPSYMWRLRIPFIFGPVAGGERAPYDLVFSLGLAATLKEFIRNLSIKIMRLTPGVIRTLRHSKFIIVTSKDTLSLIPRRYRAKTKVMLGISLSDNEVSQLERIAKIRTLNKQDDRFSIFFAGRSLYWKGMEFGLHAFAKLKHDIPYATLTIIGNGPDERKWKTIARTLMIDNSIQWITELSRDDFLESMSNFDVLLFPSLHDSGGMVVLESMACGIPTVCLDIGGPATLVTDDTGIKVHPGTPDEVVNNLYKALYKLATDSELLDSMSANCIDRAKKLFTWRSKVDAIIHIYNSRV